MKYDFPTQKTRPPGQHRDPLLTLAEAADRFNLPEDRVRSSFASVKRTAPGDLPKYQFDYNPRKYILGDLERMLRLTGDIPCKP